MDEQGSHVLLAVRDEPSWSDGDDRRHHDPRYQSSSKRHAGRFKLRAKSFTQSCLRGILAAKLPHLA
jgi:hypothetical protein